MSFKEYNREIYCDIWRCTRNFLFKSAQTMEPYTYIHMYIIDILTEKSIIYMP